MIYNIEGSPMPVVICELEDRECMICEGGGMANATVIERL